MLSATVASRRTEAGGFTERRYSPIDLYELLALANLRRRGFSVQKIRMLLQVLRERFGVRLFEAPLDQGPEERGQQALGEGGKVTLLTDGREIYARAASGEFFNLLRAPAQPLLVVGGQEELKRLSARARTRRKKTTRKRQSPTSTQPRRPRSRR